MIGFTIIAYNVCNNVLLCQLVEKATSFFVWKISLGEAITILCTIIGFIVAIWQYKKNLKSTWFLNVIVLPQLQQINEFYLKIIKNLQADKESISEHKSDAHDQYVLFLASLKEQRKEEVNNFFDHIIVLVKSYDLELGKSLFNKVMELEDIYVTIIDEYSNETFTNERIRILDNKQQFISLLNSAMSNN